MRLAKKGDPQFLMIWRQLEKASKGRVRSKYLDNHLLALMEINWGKGCGCKIFLKTPYASLWGSPRFFDNFIKFFEYGVVNRSNLGGTNDRPARH